MLFKKKSYGKKKNKTGATENPYLNAKRQWNFMMGDMIASRQIWQFVALISLIIALSCVAGIIYIGSQSKFIPYIVEVNKLGESLTAGRADKAFQNDDRITKASLARFISNARTVTTDIAIQRKNILDLYAMLSPKDAATKKMNEWFKTSPFKKAEKNLVTVEIKSVLKQSDQTWQIDWIETTRTHDGTLEKEPENMRGIFNIYFEEPEDENQIIRNPTGLYIKDFSWSQLQI